MPNTVYRTQKITSQLLLNIYHRLYRKFGPQYWWPGETPFEVVIGAILTQSTAWSNVEKAIHNLAKENILSPDGLLEINEKKLALFIRSSGYFNAKAKKIKAFIHYLFNHYDGNLQKFLSKPWLQLRDELLNIYGIGEETADSIILYAAHQPSFVVDAYTHRIFYRLGLIHEKTTYGELRKFFMEYLKPDVSLFNEYHALLVILGKNQCRKKPICTDCTLKKYCWYWKILS